MTHPSVLFCKTNEVHPLVDEVQLLQCIPKYTHVRFPDEGRTRCLYTNRHLVVKPQSHWWSIIPKQTKH